MTYLDNVKRSKWIAGEMTAALGFAKMGYGISIPFAPLPYDLIVDSGQRLFRVQVKTTELVHTLPIHNTRDRPFYMVELLRKGKDGDRRFTVDEFDVLCIGCNENIYVIPTQHIRSSVNNKFLIRQIRLKPVLPELTRLDSIDAGMRWEPFRNNFDLNTPAEPHQRNVRRLRDLVQLVLQQHAGQNGLLPSEIYEKCVAMGHEFSNRTNGIRGICNMLQRLQPKTKSLGNGRWVWAA
jgi:hypothetical protein